MGFVEHHGTQLLCKNLYRNFVLHLTNLQDFGLIGAGHVYRTIQMLQAKMSQAEVMSNIATNWEKQKKALPSACEKSPDAVMEPSTSGNPDAVTEPSTSGELTVGKKCTIQ